jgi:hypothetical protein
MIPLIKNIKDDGEDKVEVVEPPAESAEEELSQ